MFGTKKCLQHQTTWVIKEELNHSAVRHPNINKILKQQQSGGIGLLQQISGKVRRAVPDIAKMDQARFPDGRHRFLNATPFTERLYFYDVITDKYFQADPSRGKASMSELGRHGDPACGRHAAEPCLSR
jgi:hypothetical protein